ncbi:MAG: hypothetical protein C4523_04180 [Myxococcales bacterium]|nr:MAG: hypothetical protein C4523_04180 [Myxococcales bacterium]
MALILAACTSEDTFQDPPIFSPDGDQEASIDSDEPPLDGDTTDDDAPLPDGDVDDKPADGDASNDSDLPDGDEINEDGDAEMLPTDGDVAIDEDEDSSTDGDDEATGAGYYQPGPLAVNRIAVAQGQDDAPVAFLIFAPATAGEYAVVVFQHGFLMANSHYSQMLTHLASHGFVVVAPQMYAPGGLPIGKPSTPEEAALAAQLYAWLPDHLSALAGVTARTDRLGLAGHSRGGKVIWSVLKADPSLAQAVAGADPVDGQGGPLGGEQRVIDGPFDFPFPSLVIGARLGSQSGGPLQPACAPDGDNHVQFYGASASPAYHVVAEEYGHLDMLDDAPQGCGLECSACPAGPSRAPMRNLTAGQLAAFFAWALDGRDDGLPPLASADLAPIRVTMENK